MEKIVNFKGLSTHEGCLLEEYVGDYCVFDLETTGLSNVNDAVIEISSVKVVGGKIVEELSTLVNPERSIPDRISNINGIYDYMVKDSPTFETALADFLEFVGDMVLVGHNIHSFDMKFLYRDAQKYWGKTIGNNYLDTCKFSRACLPRLSSHRLTDLAEYYGISTQGAHRALNDCRMNQQVFELLKKELQNK